MALPEPDAEPAPEREIEVSARALAIAGGVLLALLILGGVVAAVRLPRATVAVTLKQQPVQAELLYDVTTNGAPLDPGVTLVATANPITTEVVFETTLPTTGKRLEPDQPAAGTVRLANIAPTEVTVAAGTDRHHRRWCRVCLC